MKTDQKQVERLRAEAQSTVSELQSFVHSGFLVPSKANLARYSVLIERMDKMIKELAAQ